MCKGWTKAAKEGGQQFFGSLAQPVDAYSDPNPSLILTTELHFVLGYLTVNASCFMDNNTHGDATTLHIMFLNVFFNDLYI